jgi:hypothetical protein
MQPGHFCHAELALEPFCAPYFFRLPVPQIAAIHAQGRSRRRQASKQPLKPA